MAKNVIEPQYTVESYATYLRNKIEAYAKFEKQQGVIADNIERKRVGRLQKIDNVLKNVGSVPDYAILQELALNLWDYNSTHFCKNKQDIIACARDTVRKYCDKDVIVAYGLDTLAQKLISCVPEEYWYSTDMTGAGAKTRMSWCSCVFSGGFKRPTVCTDVQQDSLIAQVVSSTTVDNGVVRFNGVQGVVDIFSADGVQLYSGVGIGTDTTFNPQEPLSMRLRTSMGMLVIRIWVGDDSSGIKGRKALFISLLNVETLNSFKASYT